MIIWCASYPKSGNTWVRAIVSSLLYTEDGIFDFNLLNEVTQFPRRSHFKYFTNEALRYKDQLSTKISENPGFLHKNRASTRRSWNWELTISPWMYFDVYSNKKIRKKINQLFFSEKVSRKIIF